MNTRTKKYLFSLLAAAISVVTCAQVFNPSGPIALVQTVPLTNAIYGRVGITNMVLIVRGDNVIGDGGGGVFSWLHSDTNTADNLRYFAATNGGNWYKLSYWYDGIGAGVFGVNNTFRSDWNAEDSATVELLVSSVTNFSANVVAGSLTTNQISTNFYNWIDGQGSSSSLTINSTPATNIWSTGIIDFVDDGGGDFHAELGNESITTNKWAVSAINWVLSLVSGGGTTNGFGVNGLYRTDWNVINSAEIAYTVTGVSNYYASIEAGSIATNKIDTTFYSWVESMAGGGGTNYTQFWHDLTNSLVASNNVTFAYDTGAQKLLISATTAGGSGTAVTVDGGSDLSRLNHADGTRISQTITGTNLVADLIAGTITSNYLASSSVTQDKLSATGTATSTNFLAGDWVYKQVTTNMVPGLNAILATIGTGGGSSTNILVNGTLVTQANLANGSNGMWTVDGSNIYLNITNAAGSTTDNVIQRIGYVNFVITNSSTQGDFTFTEFGGVITNINCTDCGNDAPAQVDLSFSGLTHTNYFWSFNNEGAYPATTAVLGEIATTRSTSGLSITLQDASGTAVFSQTSGYIWRFNLYQLVSVGGSGSGASFSDSAELRALLSDETGTGFAVFSDSPTFSGTVTFADLNIGTINVTTNLTVPNNAYGAGWNGSTNVPNENSVYDEMELRAPKANPTLTGTVTIPTASPGTSNTVAASTAYVDAAVAAGGGGGGGNVYTSSNNVFTGNNAFNGTVTLGGESRTNWPMASDRRWDFWNNDGAAPHGASSPNLLLPWGGAVVGSGTSVAAGSDSGGTEINGYLRLSSAASSGSGYAYLLSVSSLTLKTNCFTMFEVRPQATNATVITERIGWQDTASTSLPTDGLFWNRDGNSVTLLARNNSVSTESTAYTIESNAWYFVTIATHDLGSSDIRSEMQIWDSTPTLVSTLRITNGLPLTTARSTGHGVVAFSTNNVAVNLSDISKLWLAMPSKR